MVCASLYPPVFGLFSAIPASFVAVTGLPLRLFVPQAAERSRPRHPRVPRRRMSSRMVRNSKIFGANAALASKSINSHGTLPLSSPSSEMRGELSDRPSYECCFSTFRPSVPQYWYLCKPSSTCFRPVFALPASFAAAAGIPLRLFVCQVNVNQVQGLAIPKHDALHGFIMKKYKKWSISKSK